MATNRLFTFIFLSISAQAQVLAPAEITDATLRGLQEKKFADLKEVASAIREHSFPYHFYLSRKLDLSEARQQGTDQRGIQFDNYQGQLVLKITGNYFASYSADRMTESERARATYSDVMLPILMAVVPRLSDVDAIQSFALEISHHARKKVLGVTNEEAENVVLILPKLAAQRLVAARDDAGRRSAVLEGSAFLNANPVALWPDDERLVTQRREPVSNTSTVLAGKAAVFNNGLQPAAVTPASIDVSPEALKRRDVAYQPDIEKLLKELDSQAHFVTYAPPAFMAFHDGAYLQLSLTSALSEEEGASLYRMAALAFDRHVAHLIRPVMAHFKDCGDFTGVDFSTSIRTKGKGQEADSVEAVEYIFMLTELEKYDNYDVTGQDLIRSGFILINGERVSLDLQEAEGKK